MKQATFAELEHDSKRRRTPRGIFLEKMDRLVPWKRLEKRIEPFYPKAGRGRRPYPLRTMLRVHCVQLFYNLSDPGMEDLLYEVESVRRFAGLRTPRLREGALPGSGEEHTADCASAGFLESAHRRPLRHGVKRGTIAPVFRPNGGKRDGSRRIRSFQAVSDPNGSTFSAEIDSRLRSAWRVPCGDREQGLIRPSLETCSTRRSRGREARLLRVACRSASSATRFSELRREQRLFFGHLVSCPRTRGHLRPPLPGYGVTLGGTKGSVMKLSATPSSVLVAFAMALTNRSKSSVIAPGLVESLS